MDCKSLLENLSETAAAVAPICFYCGTGCDSKTTRISGTLLPVMHGPIQFSVHRKIGTVVWIFRCKLFINVHAKARSFPGMHEPVLEGVGVWKHTVGFVGVLHICLDAKVVYAQIKMQSRPHAHRTQVRGTVRTGPDLVHFGKIGDPSQMRNPTGVHHRGANVVN